MQNINLIEDHEINSEMEHEYWRAYKLQLAPTNALIDINYVRNREIISIRNNLVHELQSFGPLGMTYRFVNIMLK